MSDTHTLEGWVPTATSELQPLDAVKWQTFGSRRGNVRYSTGLVQSVDAVECNNSYLVTIKSIEGYNLLIASKPEDRCFRVYQRGTVNHDD